MPENLSQDSLLRVLVRDRVGLRIDREMAKYLAARSAAGGPVPVIGEDARTGVSRRELIDPAALRLEQS